MKQLSSLFRPRTPLTRDEAPATVTPDSPPAPPPEVEQLRDRVRSLEREMHRLRTVITMDQAHHARWNQLAATLDTHRISASIARAFSTAAIVDTPMPHLVLRDVWPQDTYAAFLEAIPPEEFFPDRDPIKQNLKLTPVDATPAWTRYAIEFLEQVAIPDLLTPALVSHLRPYLERVHQAEHGPERGAQIAALPHVATKGRLMLRRPGYRLEPHFDPQRAVFTCLLYFARPGDDAAYGTQLFSVAGTVVVDRTKTFYPAEHGHECTLVKTVPFEPNTALVFLNRVGAHAAEIPRSAPKDTRRYSYQFYVSPQAEALDAPVVDSLIHP